MVFLLLPSNSHVIIAHLFLVRHDRAQTVAFPSPLLHAVKETFQMSHLCNTRDCQGRLFWGLYCSTYLHQGILQVETSAEQRGVHCSKGQQALNERDGAIFRMWYSQSESCKCHSPWPAAPLTAFWYSKPFAPAQAEGPAPKPGRFRNCSLLIHSFFLQVIPDDTRGYFQACPTQFWSVNSQ